MEGTRVSLLKDLQQWSMDVAAPPIFWLDGMAGTGKSAIAHSFCRYLDESHRLGGSFFCQRGNESRANVKRILPTLAWFLARQYSQYKSTLFEVLRDAPDVADHPIQHQVELLLEIPLHRVFVDRQLPPLVLAIDSLDECADPEEVEQLLNKLLCVCKDLPVKFFLTSRPERHIVAHFESLQPEFHRVLRLHDIQQDLVEADILLYLKTRLADIRSSRRFPSVFPPVWPSPRDIEILTRLSGKLFIYAFTAVKFIAAKNHVKRLQKLTRLTVDAGQPFYRPLDKMYSLVLSHALDPNECTSEEIYMTKRILGAIITIREPLRLSDFAKLLVVAPDEILGNTDRIRAVVNIPPSGEDGVVYTFHASFIDFLTTPGRAPENMRITLSTAHRDLANGCLQIMNSDLHFNIANCTTSHFLNSKQTLATIPAPLKYASLHWAHHLDAADDTCSLLPLLENFLFEKFLFWLEVLSVSGMAGRASSIIARVSERTVSCNFVHVLITISLMMIIQSQNMTENIDAFLHDANYFVVAFRDVIETSVAHIYLSALPSQHKTSKIAEVFMPIYPSLIRVTTKGVHQRCVPRLELCGHTDNVISVGFSPDGAHIVSGSHDRTIRIWDVRTGDEVTKPLVGHTDAVISVDFSPDGAHIVSGSRDQTIRIWDARTGEEVMKPFVGHMDTVTSVCFSLDGTLIGSGSHDQTIRIWDARTGEEVMEPLESHTDTVTSVCFSLDGTRIVSGSWDKTIRIWDARTGEEVMKPLVGHTDTVTSVGFSRDGTRIVSGSLDKTVRIWDASTGEEVMKPPKEHTAAVTSVAFSPDGTHIVSGSRDKTIRILDARTGEEVTKPLRGHKNKVTCVNFSPDGHIVSGSWDKTIRIWDAWTDDSEEAMKPLSLKGHTQPVTYVGFSPDGKHIVSGSWDHTIRRWDARTGEAVTMPLKGHTNTVTSVCFSLDGTHIISASRDKTIRIWDAKTGKEVMKPLKGHKAVVTSVGFSPDGTHIVSGSRDKTIRILNARTGVEVTKPLEGHTNIIKCVGFSPDGTRIVSGSRDETIRIWDARTGEGVMEPLKGHTADVTSVGFSADGARIVSGSYDKTIRIWDARTGEEVMKPLVGHTDNVTSVGFSPDGTRIVSGSRDETVRIWDASTGEEVMNPPKEHTAAVTSVAFSPDGTHIVSGSYDKTIRIWDANPLQEHSRDITPHMKSIVSTTLLPNLQLFLQSEFCFIHDDGWIRGPHQELILWVLPEWRQYLPWHPCILNTGRPHVHFDLGRYVHGSEWIRCKSNS